MRCEPLNPAMADVVTTWVRSPAEAMMFAGPSLPWPLTAEDILRVAAADQRSAWHLLDGGEPVAFGCYRLVDNTARIGWILVAPEHRGKGWGRLMMQFLIERASACPGVSRIDLRVFEGNTAAHTLYSSLGFRDTGDPRSHLLDGEDWITTGMELSVPTAAPIGCS